MRSKRYSTYLQVKMKRKTEKKLDEVEKTKLFGCFRIFTLPSLYLFFSSVGGK